MTAIARALHSLRVLLGRLDTFFAALEAKPKSDQTYTAGKSSALSPHAITVHNVVEVAATKEQRVAK
jgi:hypothetical protein